MHGLSYNNNLLQLMDFALIERLQLTRTELPARTDLERPGELVKDLFFIEHGIACMATEFSNGVKVETSLFGHESVIGVSALMGVRRSLNPIFMLLSGSGFTCRVEVAHAEFETSTLFRRLSLRYVQTQLTLSTQNAACNATHTYEQRLARWLLICSDRAGSNTLEMAQDFLSEMLGSTRSTVSIAAAHLKAKGLIDYHRGTILLLKKKELEDEACECYRVVRDHLESPREFRGE
jgi:CRP-like cAMP-binding protein